MEKRRKKREENKREYKRREGERREEKKKEKKKGSSGFLMGKAKELSISHSLYRTRR